MSSGSFSAFCLVAFDWNLTCIIIGSCGRVKLHKDGAGPTKNGSSTFFFFLLLLIIFFILISSLYFCLYYNPPYSQYHREYGACLHLYVYEWTSVFERTPDRNKPIFSAIWYYYFFFLILVLCMSVSFFFCVTFIQRNIPVRKELKEGDKKKV